MKTDSELGQELSELRRKQGWPFAQWVPWGAALLNYGYWMESHRLINAVLGWLCFVVGLLLLWAWVIRTGNEERDLERSKGEHCAK